MPGRGEDDVIAREVAIAEVFAVNPGIGDHAGDIFGRMGAAFGGEAGEIGFEIGDCASDQLGDRLGRQVLDPGLIEVFVLSAEHLLGKHQHPRLVCFGHTENLHHDMERIGRGDELDEIHIPAAPGPTLTGSEQPIDRVTRQLADICLDTLQILGHEPFLGQLAELGVERRVEHDQ